MNIYFLVEGKTEKKLYPKWLDHLAPQLTKVDSAYKATENNYYLISGFGYPSILGQHLSNSIADINEYKNYHKLVLVIDADDMSVDEKLDEVYKHIADSDVVLNEGCTLEVIAQKYCLETWFLGNKKAVSRNPASTSNFYKHAQFYDVLENDPELMSKPQDWTESTSGYHYTFLKKMLAEKNINYSKSQPYEVAKPYYIDELKKRTTETNHLNSLKRLFDFCESINNVH